MNYSLAIDRVLMRKSFRRFVEVFWSSVVPGRTYVPNIASDAIVEHLQAVADGKISRLAISIAPGLASRAYWLRRHPRRSQFARATLSTSLAATRSALAG